MHNSDKEPKKLELTAGIRQGLYEVSGLELRLVCCTASSDQPVADSYSAEGCQGQHPTADCCDRGARRGSCTGRSASRPAGRRLSKRPCLLAFVGAAPEVKVDWTPKSEGATGLEALATAQAQQEVTLGGRGAANPRATGI